MTLEEIQPDEDYVGGVYNENPQLFKSIAENRDKLGDSFLNVGLDHNPNGRESTPSITPS